MPHRSDIAVDLWRWRLDDPAEAARLKGFLSGDEAARASQFYGPIDETAFIIRRGRLREILSARIGVPPTTLSFEYNVDGKPEVPGGPAFSLSHSAGYALLAVSDHGPLGVDVEAFKPLSTKIDDIFTSDELRELDQHPDSEKAIQMFRLWTQKEALSKALGIGVWLSAGAFSVSRDKGAPRVVSMSADDPAHWTLVDLEGQIGMPSILAIRAAGRVVCLRFH